MYQINYENIQCTFMKVLLKWSDLIGEPTKPAFLNATLIPEVRPTPF